MTENELFPVNGLERSFHPWIPHSKQAQTEQDSTEDSTSARNRSTYSSGRKQACSRCAKRRRKCDSQLPSCSTCCKAGSRCFYPFVNSTSGIAIPRSQESTTKKAPYEGLEARKTKSFDLDLPSTHHHQALTSVANSGSSHVEAGLPPELDLNDIIFPQPYTWPTLPFIFDSWIQNNEENVEVSVPQAGDRANAGDVALRSLPALASENIEREPPDPSLVKELLDGFFQDYHKYLPCLHRKSIYDLIENDNSVSERSPLILALLAVAATSHKVKIIQELQQEWLQRAKRLWHVSVASTDNPTRNIQAAVYILFADILNANINESWLFLGTASRYASLMGADRIDCPNAPKPSDIAWRPNDSVDTEERRRSMWALRTIDTKLSSLCGMPLAIDDRMFNVNFPAHENAFQDGDMDNLLRSFTTDLNSLVGPNTFHSDPAPSTYELVLRAMTLLGQITLYNGTQQVRQPPAERSEEFAHIEGALIRFALALSRYDIATVDLEELDYAVWLHVTVQTCVILFYHPKVLQCAITGTRGVSDAPAKIPPSFKHAANAAENLIRLVKDVIPRSIEALLNPFFLGVFFLCCRFKIVMWKTYHASKDRDDLDMMIMLVDQFATRWGPFGQKYRDKIGRDFKIAEEDTEESHKL